MEPLCNHADYHADCEHCRTAREVPAPVNTLGAIRHRAERITGRDLRTEGGRYIPMDDPDASDPFRHFHPGTADYERILMRTEALWRRLCDLYKIACADVIRTRAAEAEAGRAYSRANKPETIRAKRAAWKTAQIEAEAAEVERVNLWHEVAAYGHARGEAERVWSEGRARYDADRAAQAAAQSGS